MVLDVGSGGGGIARFVCGGSFGIVVVDVRREVFSFRTRSVERIIADSGFLPFRDRSFGAATCVDLIEHIPRDSRNKCLQEIVRVANIVVMTFPTTSRDGLYRAKEYDAMFQQWHMETFGREDEATAEHMRLGIPSIDEVRRLIPCMSITGIHNCDVWYRHMKLGKLPLIRYFTGILYYALWKKYDNRPPFWGVVICYGTHHAHRRRKFAKVVTEEVLPSRTRLHRRNPQSIGNSRHL